MLITSVSLQVRPQAPQFRASEPGFTSQPSLGVWLQSCQGEVQAKLHFPAAHCALLLGPKGQALPQTPQCWGLVLVFTH
jgi:hypothetical protein